MKKLWRIFAVVTALCMMLTTVAFAAEAADDATTAEEPAATDEAAEGEEEPAADDTEEPVNTVVQPDDNLYPVALDDYNGLSQIPFMTRLFTQNHINWTLVQLGEPVEGVFGQTVEANWDNTKFLIEWKDTDTNNFTQDPLLVLQISDNGILQEPLTSGTVGELGYCGYYTFTFTDITLKSDGFEDVLIPGRTIENYKLQAKQEAGWISGAAYELDLMPEIKAQLGLDTQQISEYIYNLSSVTTTVTFNAYNGVTTEALEEMKAEAEAAEAAVLEEIQQYVDAVDAAAAVVDDEAASLEDKQAAVEDALEAANAAIALATGHLNAEEIANGLLDKADELGETVLELQKELEEAEEEENQAEEPSADDEAPAADDAEEGAPAVDSESGSSTVVIVIVVVVVVIAIIAVVVVLGKKKKA